MKTFLHALEQQIKSHETMVRTRAKKQYEPILQAMRIEAPKAYEKWLATKFYNYYPSFTYVDVDQATALAEQEIPDFEFYVRMLAANVYLRFFSKWILQSKHKIQQGLHFEDGSDQ